MSSQQWTDTQHCKLTLLPWCPQVDAYFIWFRYLINGSNISTLSLEFWLTVFILWDYSWSKAVSCSARCRRVASLTCTQRHDKKGQVSQVLKLVSIRELSKKNQYYSLNCNRIEEIFLVWLWYGRLPGLMCQWRWRRYLRVNCPEGRCNAWRC